MVSVRRSRLAVSHPSKDEIEECKNRAFSLMWLASMLIYWNKRKFLHKKRVQFPQGCLGTPTYGRCFIVLEHQYGCRDVMSKDHEHVFA